MGLLITTCWRPKNSRLRKYLGSGGVAALFITRSTSQPGEAQAPGVDLGMKFHFGADLCTEVVATVGVGNRALSFCESAFLCWLAQVACAYLLSKEYYFLNESMLMDV